MYCACVLHTLDEESQMHVHVGDEGSDTRRYMETSSCRPPVSPFQSGVAISVPWMSVAFARYNAKG